MWRGISAWLVLSTCIIAGCSKDDDSTAGSPAPTPAVDAGTSHPTTQQLLNGPRTAMDVKFAPVTLQVPPGWEVKSYKEGSLVTIEGQTPTDVVSISVPVYRTISVDQEKSLESQAKQDFVAHPDLLAKAGVRDITGGKVIERLIPDPLLATTQLAGAATTEPIQTLQWTFTVCVPTSDGKEFNAYDLRFLGMTLQQYKTDQAFLRSIMDSMTYSSTADILTK